MLCTDYMYLLVTCWHTDGPKETLSNHSLLFAIKNCLPFVEEEAEESRLWCIFVVVLT